MISRIHNAGSVVKMTVNGKWSAELFSIDCHNNLHMIDIGPERDDKGDAKKDEEALRQLHGLND